MYNEAFWVSLGIFLLVFGLIALVLGVLCIIGLWNIFKKAGKPGWAAIIPFYNTYVTSDVVFGNNTYFIISMVLTVISWIAKGADINFLVSIINLATIVLYIIFCINLSKVFQKSGGFTVGLVILPFIFLPILGFGSSVYTGPAQNNKILV